MGQPVIKPTHVKPIAGALVRLFAEAGLTDSALAVGDWTELGALLTSDAANHIELTGGNSAIGSISVRSSQSVLGEVITVFDGASVKSSALTNRLRWLVFASTRGEVGPEVGDGYLDSGRTSLVRHPEDVMVLPAQPTCVRTPWDYSGTWLQFSEGYALYEPPTPEQEGMPWLHIRVFADWNGRGYQGDGSYETVWYTQTRTCPSTYYLTRALHAFMQDR